MWTVSPPPDPAGPLFLSCVTGIRDKNLKDLKDRLAKAAPSVADADRCYREAGADRAFGRLHQADFELPGVTAREMTWLYENKMVRKTAPGRQVYEPSGRRARRGGARCAVTGT